MAHTSLNMMIERAAEYHTLANQRRARGHHYGASAAGWVWKRPEPDPDDLQAHASRARNELRKALWTALNEYQAAIQNGPGWDEDIAELEREFFNEIPF